MTIFTIGHSTRPINEFIDLLKKYGVTHLVDIRTVPGSRHNPQYGQEALKNSLAEADIHYTYLKELGGLRPKTKGSTNLGWHNISFRNYADYMQTDEFRDGIEELIQLARNAPSAIMCAEALPWRCHRSLVSDALLVRHINVRDIMSITSATEHTLTSFAHIEGTKITYPSDD